MPIASSAPSEHDEWTMVIQPKRPLLDIHLDELWHARDLISLFVRRDFVAQYKQTILGPLWFLIQPLLTTITFSVIFGRIAGLPTDGLPQFLFYLSGTIIWGYFASCLTKTSNTFLTNASLFQKIYFPRLAVPISISISNLIAFGIQFVLFLVTLLFFIVRGAPVYPNAAILLVPLLLLMMAGLGMGLGIIVSSMTTRYRDLQHLVAFGTQLLMYATPVIYPVSSIPEPYQQLIYLNPLTSIVETFRYAFLGAGTFSIPALTYSFICTVVVLAVGILLFNRIEKTFMDTV
ncbi:MAG: ABC transporter permease [Caldilineaceae bacterium]|nr:ABC transporter permease [Caldilineaceae bacterium]